MNGPPGGDLPYDGWSRWLEAYDGLGILVVVCFPLAVLAVVVLVGHRRRSGSSRARAWRRSVAEVGLLYATAPGIWLTLQPGHRAGAVSLTPFEDLATMSTVQLVGNLLLLAPVGLLAPVRFAALATWPRAVATAATCSVLVESAQHLLRLDRVSSVDDVLLNTAGAGLAALVSRPWWCRSPRVAAREARASVSAR